MQEITQMCLNLNLKLFTVIVWVQFFFFVHHEVFVLNIQKYRDREVNISI